MTVPWTASQSILKEINPELKGLMLKLKLQYFAHLMQIVNSLEKTLILGKIEGIKRVKEFNSVTDSMDMKKIKPVNP